MDANRLIGLAYVAERMHSGQWSRGYRLLSRIRWEPRTDRQARLADREEWAEVRQWAAHYLRYGPAASSRVLKVPALRRALVTGGPSGG